ncbi:hypothetical protein CEXT_364811 [Caerostris extrusa]|uniref:Uncharacterized protein n=1 Tax=Caerostris extrusa TaxID=172846 RepID=A0AAV4X8C0_CAEEX|nr:hypothetical protein CEXT_364811 [Caerostris extrusa]
MAALMSRSNVSPFRLAGVLLLVKYYGELVKLITLAETCEGDCGLCPSVALSVCEVDWLYLINNWKFHYDINDQHGDSRMVCAVHMLSPEIGMFPSPNAYSNKNHLTQLVASRRRQYYTKYLQVNPSYPGSVMI